MSIDSGERHYDNAGSMKAACGHISVFLGWAAGRGLLGDGHDAERVQRSPVHYVMDAMDANLLEMDFTDEGAAFAEACYEDFLADVSAAARRWGVGDYQIYRIPAAWRDLHASLDSALQIWRMSLWIREGATG